MTSTTVVLPMKENTFEKSVLLKSAIIAGSTVSAAFLIPKAVFFARYLILIVESIRKQYPVLLPTLGGAAITILHLFRKDIVKRGPDALFSDEFDAVHHLMRVLAVVVTVGSGCSLAFVGAAGEIGATVIRLSCSLLAIAMTHASRICNTGLDSSNSNSNSTVVALTQTYLHTINLAGAAAGVAANFDAPFTGAMYSYEVARRWNSRRSVSGSVAAVGSEGDSSLCKLVRAVDLPSLLPALFGSFAAGMCVISIIIVIVGTVVKGLIFCI